MSWTLTVTNKTGRTIIAPPSNIVYVEGWEACINVVGLGNIRLLDIGHRPGTRHYWSVQVTSGGYQQIWSYEGGGQVSLTLNEDETFTLTGFGQTLSAKIGGAPPTVTYLPAKRVIYALGLTNAAWKQKITLTADGMRSQYWTGVGEGNTEMMRTSFTTPAGSDGQVPCAILFDHAEDGKTWQPSRVSPVGNFSLMGYNQRTIVAEDASDNDWNDSALILNWWNPPPGA